MTEQGLMRPEGPKAHQRRDGIWNCGFRCASLALSDYALRGHLEARRAEGGISRRDGVVE